MALEEGVGDIGETDWPDVGETDGDPDSDGVCDEEVDGDAVVDEEADDEDVTVAATEADGLDDGVADVVGVTDRPVVGDVDRDGEAEIDADTDVDSLALGGSAQTTWQMATTSKRRRAEERLPWPLP